jgi:hypothetical protein
MSTRPVGALPTMRAAVASKLHDVAVLGQHDVHRRDPTARHALGDALVQRRWRYSPCTGMKNRGRDSDSTSFSSSSLPWPDTCTCVCLW